ncbi:ATP-dependent RNA helicase ddx23 [Hondaea fermentalgiana]|uniref:RNA helicase n=1 Tax=Hondaea fermentalgiana TaxID=2315210 RepID=A0A2R5FZ01_9STRA|nr:ATP-dependent RNA helicase ddx23 [Hondaea fermentalgiana]|eukprot:GBG23986.1 ATP-dependent RNA helicase ddx23 [Hondaea fermentalgiana]
MNRTTAQKLYDESLASLMVPVRVGKRGIFRVMMAPEGWIQSVKSVRASAKPCPSSFTLFVPGDKNRKPRFGQLDQLDKHQQHVASILAKDMEKLFRTSEIAYVLQGKSPVLDAEVKNRLNDITERFGLLPEPALKDADDRERNLRLEQQRLAEEKEQIWQEVQPTIFEQLLEQERAFEAENQEHLRVRCASSGGAAAHFGSRAKKLSQQPDRASWPEEAAAPGAQRELSPEEQAEAERFARIAARAEAIAAEREAAARQGVHAVADDEQQQQQQQQPQLQQHSLRNEATTATDASNASSAPGGVRFMSKAERERQRQLEAEAEAAKREKKKAKKEKKHKKKKDKEKKKRGKDSEAPPAPEPLLLQEKRQRQDGHQVSLAQQTRRRVLHWSEKTLEEMTDRDWRIVREDHDIYTKGSTVPNPARSWDEMQLPRELRETIRGVGYTRPSPIQMQAIPIGLQRRDIIGVAETGSGKTAAFVVPLAVHLGVQTAEKLASCSEDGPLAVIMAPTRELAQQIGEEARKLTIDARIAVVVGGNAIQDQINELRRGAYVVVATPGRLLDCLEHRYVVFNQCDYLVLDEADRMIDMGFEPQVHAVIGNMRGEADARVTIMFSATMPPAVERLAQKYMKAPAIVRIGDKDSSKNRNIAQQVYFLPSEAKKRDKLTQLIRDSAPPIIVFANSKRGCDVVYEYLQAASVRATVLHGGKAQAQREASLEAFKEKRFDVLIATDVAGRGLDIANVSHVINFEMPTEIERYEHRIGRTGRAGKKGLASTLLTDDDEKMFPPLVRFLRSSKASVPQALASHPAIQQAILK